MEPKLALGIDAGGTSARAILIDQAGAVLGTGTAGPANPVGGDRETALSNMALAARHALGDIDPGAIAAACVGAAGALSGPETMRRMAAELRSRFGTECEVELVSDAVIAFAAGSPSPDGTVVISGTGAVAFGIRGHLELARRADGYGWLLGDAGSGFWIGREAVGAALRHLDGNGPGGPLVESVVAALAPGERRARALVTRCMAEPPVRLARLASLVCEAAELGDPVAAAIVSRAVEHLTETVGSVMDPKLPIVMAGSLLTRSTPVAALLRERLSAAHPQAALGRATDPAVGAAWLAARAFGADEDERRRLHERLARR